MLVAGINSRPTYPGSAPGCRSHEHVLYAETASAENEFAAQLVRLPIQFLHRIPTLTTALQRLKAVISPSRMGTRTYAASSETLIGPTVQIAQELGMDPQSVIAEHRGALARQIQFTEDVRTNIVKCAHCHSNLLVRDHYSKRLAAFQGVCGDAEIPGELPEIAEVFK